MSTLVKMGGGEVLSSGYTTQIIAIRPRSAGRVRLQSADPLAKPRIEDLYLGASDGTDLATLREGIKLGRRMCNEAAFDEYRGEEVYPGPSVRATLRPIAS